MNLEDNNREISPYLKMDRFSYGNIVRIGKNGNIKVGSFTSIASGVKAIMVGHNTDWISTYPFSSREMRNYFKNGLPSSIHGHPREYGDILIGSDVWIGQDVSIMGGIYIGHGSIIGAGSIVTKDVAPYSVEAGIPSVTRKMRFTQEQINRLLDIEWWNWPIGKINSNLDLICSPNIGEFLRIHG